MKIIAVLGWVAAVAAMLAVAVLLMRPPVVVQVPAPLPPVVAEGHPELRGIKTVGITLSGKGVPEEVYGRVADELKAGGLTVVDDNVDASFSLALRVSPIPRTDRLMISSEAIGRAEAIVKNGGKPVRTPVVVWLAIHALAADEHAVGRGMVEMAVQHARKFAADVKAANP